MGRRKVIKQLEALQADVTAWQDHHRKRVRHLERQVTDIELSVARAEADAHHAALLMWDIETNLLRRIEEIEQRMEIRLLMRQGRIPAEALELLADEDGGQGAGVDDDKLLDGSGQRDVQQA